MNKLKNDVISNIGNKNIQKFIKLFNKSKTNNKKILLDIDVNNYIYKEFNSEYYDFKTNHFCKDYNILNITLIIFKKYACVYDFM